MKILIIIFLLAMVFGLFGCESSPFVRIEEGTFELKHGQTVFVTGPNMRLTFEGEVEDSRCCMTCFCIWPGQGTIHLTVEQYSKSSVIRLSTAVGGNSIPPVYVDTLGYRFELVSLDPYPESGRYPDEEYTATIEVTKSPVVTVVPMVRIVDIPPTGFAIKPYGLDSARIVGDKLSLWVNYSGGCEEHYFQLYMSPSVFQESNPQQANLHLSHFGPPDLCERLVHQKLEFSLIPIEQLYHSTVSGGGGELKLNLWSFCSSLPGPGDQCYIEWTGSLWVPGLPD